ncbi:RuBisCO LSMT substrate-binding protein (macronuclear) [Tetrahymena thermophila SB210]|uniref:RuBisCO LSMT substrate-binding protein n=1 Tax=Tetrahymena thermophila (strain SB210) TaxID=312017 RepID=W7XGH2_TETTS|nr:RuBisCO LSMT substrate-binding protein [Tetrahymena thermophila SB210]EWS71999.1 RuBisCO LSMT substrate-binding protein [Tetrahymena thermophila SB210]|eukprot:XP_012655467.1 RuBisCO LSMT substrate-binding protein [Tetrahymena thermophila SB210]
MIEEDELNIEETLKLQSDQRYIKFKQWCIDNGAIMEGIQFPAAFGPLGVPGIAADQDISPQKVILAIPNKLIISEDKVYGCDLEEVLEKFPELFDEEKCGDADFNILALYLMYEKLKGEQSFWHPYFELNQKSYTLLDWSTEELAQFEDSYILQELQSLKNEMEKQWRNMDKVVKLYPQYFPQDKVNKELFYYCYELCMTRGYGWTLPSVCLVPLADMFNHNCDTTTHYIINREFEQHPKKAHEKYRIKKHKINLQLMKDPLLVFTEEDKIKNNLYQYQNRRLKYVYQFREYLSEESQKNLDLKGIDWIPRDELRQLCAEINVNKLKQTKEQDLFTFKFYPTTESEDNDTSDDEKTERKGQNQQLKEAELEKFFNLKSEPKPQKQKKKKWEEDVLLEKEEDGIIMQVKQLTIHTTKKAIQDDQNKKEGEEKEEVEQEDWESCDSSSDFSDVSDESDFSWYDDEDEENYFVVTTRQPEKKGQQLYNCYGQRTNRFLLMWYGFAFLKNRYDSYSFRLWMNMQVEKLNDILFEKIVFQEYLASDTCSGGFVWKKKEKVDLKDLTQEFRIKKNEICIDLIIYLRLYLMMHYKGPDFKRIIASLPVSPIYESFVLSFAVKLLQYLRNKYTTSVEEDQKTLLNPDINYRLRFAVIYRLNQKLILDEQIKLLNQTILVINKLDSKLSLVENLLNPIYANESDNQSQIYINRYKLRPYLQQLQESIEKNLFKYPKDEIFDILK